MLDKETERLLALYADNQPHSFFETCILAKTLFRKGDKYIWNKFRNKLLFNGWVTRLHKSWTPYLDFYQLTPKGDACYRSFKLARLEREKNAEEATRHFKYFDRSVNGKFGAEGMGQNITEESAKLREKFPHLYGQMSD